ncbi:MAG TPA: hypothetical protein VJ779_21220 [Acetobacteraceae bacterium]|nr:hypothetical protein [Acetobacteraceae bacterium]
MATTGDTARAAPPWGAGWTVAITTFLVLQSAAVRAEPSAQEQARQQRLRLLCALTFGDFSEPFEALMFRRCLAHPEQVLRPRRPINMPLLVNPHPTPLLRPGMPPGQAEIASRARPADAQQSPNRLPQQLRPLGPGLNKGNIDSNIGAQRYYFWAGPGEVRVSMAFKEMGVFGNPFRQALTFDFLNEAGRLLSHNAIVSEGRLEAGETGGNLAARQKLILLVKPQEGLIRMGGYYEIRVTGAATFDRSTPEGTNVVPEDTSLVHPGTSLVRPGGASLIAPGKR